MKIMHLSLKSKFIQEQTPEFCEKLDEFYDNLKKAGAETLYMTLSDAAEIKLHIETEKENFKDIVKDEFEKLEIGSLAIENNLSTNATQKGSMAHNEFDLVSASA